MTPISIRFPMTRERTGNRRGPRLRRIPDATGLHGAASCACRMLHSAILHRESRPSAWETPERAALFLRYKRASMRNAALWARVFAGHLETRILAAQAEATAAVERYCAPSLKAA